MRRQTLQKAITTSKVTLPASIFICILGWVVVFILLPGLKVAPGTYPVWEQIQSLLAVSDGLGRVASLITFMLIGYFLIGLNNSYAIIRIRASVQTSLYLLFVTAVPIIHPYYIGDIATLFFILSLYFLFRTYQHTRPAGLIFHSFVCAGTGSLLFPQFTYLAPVLLIGTMMLSHPTWKSFFGAILGWSVPYWIFFAYTYLTDQIPLFYEPFIELTRFQPIGVDSFDITTFVTLAYFFLLFIISAIHSIATSFKDKIRTRIFLRFFIIMDIAVFLFILLQPIHCMSFLPIFLVGVSLLAGHLFVLTNSKTSNAFFILAMIGLVALFCFNLWMLL